MPNDLDELMARLDTDVTLPKIADVEALIEYYRKHRVAPGTRATKAQGPKITLDDSIISRLIKAPPPKAAAIKRRF